MCGIIYYKGTEKPLAEIFNLVFEQKHRGKEDGFGFYDFKNNIFEKTTLTLAELIENKINPDRWEEKNIPKQIKKSGKKIVEKYIKETKELWDAEVKKWRNLLDLQTSEILFHHRKATTGYISFENTQPFLDVKENRLYAHNGTCYGAGAIREYMREFEQTKFLTEVDTEVLKTLFLKLHEKVGDKKIVEKISKFFDFGIFFISDLKNHKIIMDGNRPLYWYEIDENNDLLISEPSFQIKKFKGCILLINGILKIEKERFVFEGKFLDVTKKLREVLSKHRHRKCDMCKIVKETIDIGRDDVCLDCYCSGRYKISKQTCESSIKWERIYDKEKGYMWGNTNKGKQTEFINHDDRFWWQD